MAQRGKDQRPRQFTGDRERVVALVAAGQDEDAEVGAGFDVEVADVAAGLADELELRQLFEDVARDVDALLGQQQHIEALDLFDDARRIEVGIVVDDDFMALQFRKGARLAQRVGVVVYDSDFHGACPQ